MFAVAQLARIPARFRYVVALAAVVARTLIRWAMDPWLGPQAPFTVFFFGVMFSAFVGGLGPGLFATVLSLLASHYFFTEPRYILLALDLPHEPLSFALYALVGIFVSVLCQILRSSEGSARRSEASFRALAEGMPHMVWETDTQGMNHYQNQVWYDYIGAGPGSSFGTDWLQYYHPEDREHLMAEWKAALAGNGNHVYDIETRIRRHDGVYRWFRIKGSPIRDASGAIIRWAGTCTDIDDQKRAAEAVRASEWRFRTLADAMPVLVWQCDVSRQCDYFSREWLRFTGRTMEQELGEGWAEGVHPEDASRVMERFHTAFDRREPFQMEYRLRHHSGEYRWVLDHGVPRFDPDGRYMGHLGGCLDITERKRMEERLRQSEALYRAIASNIPDGLVSVVDRDMRYRAVDGPLLAGFGQRPQELEGHRPAEVLEAELAQLVEGRMRRALAGETTQYETERNGRVFWSEYLPLRDANGQVMAAMSLMLDITQRKRAEQTAARQAAELSALYATAPVGLFAFDADLRFVRINQMMAELNGLPVEQHIGRSLRDILAPGLADEVVPLLRRVMEAGQPVLDIEVHGATTARADEQRDWLVSYYPVRGEDGIIRGVHGVVQEITRRKAIEAALAAAKRSADMAKAAAEEASRAKDHFLAVLSHELRTPLTPVLAGVAMLQADLRLDSDVQELLSMMRRNAELEAQLIDDLLDATRIARGKIELKRQRIKLCEVLQRAVSICRPDIEARGLHFGVDMGPDAPYLLEADVMRLQQVFWNLLRNAIKFTPHGGCIGIRCRLDHGHVVAEINDSGMGIAPDDLQRIFNAFEQGERSVTRQFGGLGLGLAICKSLVEMHGGAIEAQSDGRNKGASFRIRLPIVAAGTGTVMIQSDGSPTAAAIPRRSVSVAHRILLVEDHGDTARLMKRLLEVEGHKVQTAGDVSTALELAGSQEFDLMISDLGLPDGSGVDLMRTLRSRGSSLPGIALSGYGQVEDIRRSREAGFSEHLTKPTDPDRLAEAIRMVTAHPGKVTPE